MMLMCKDKLHAVGWSGARAGGAIAGYRCRGALVVQAAVRAADRVSARQLFNPSRIRRLSNFTPARFRCAGWDILNGGACRDDSALDAEDALHR